jgi:hypothetical protein
VNVAQLGATDFPQHFEAAVKFLPIVRIECKPSVSARKRFHLIEDGTVLEANAHVEDPGAFPMPWDAIQ